MMPFPLIFLLGIVIPWTSTAAAQSLPGCPNRCGDLKVPYPFGMAKGCYLADKFFITCNKTFQPPKAFLNSTNLPLSSISLDNGELAVWQSIARECRNHSKSKRGTRKDLPNRATISLPPVTVSGTENKFTALGCDTHAVLRGYRGKETFTTECTSLCNSSTIGGNITYESCSGVRCCQTSIPSGLTNITVSVSSFRSGNYSEIPDSDNHPERREFNPCSYAFVVEESKFSFSNSSFEELENTEMLPLVVDWAIGDENCEEAEKKSNFSCKANSSCVDPSNRPAAGYLCRCLPGYQGNPYVEHGCQDIDECEIWNPCENGKCRNVPGNWSCKCPTGYVRTKTGCSKLHASSSGKRLLRYIGPGICISLLVLVMGSSYAGIYWAVKKRNFLKSKEKFFEQNGGLILKQYLQGHRHTIKIFTKEELTRATDNYHEKTLLLGEGSFNKVYKGALPNKVVVIKESKIVNQAFVEKFINRVIQFSQIKHRNVVELLGCCLETEVPLLVYEFIQNGSRLSHHFLHNGQESLLSREIRLKIALQVAQALTYMHSDASLAVIHGNVNLSNILLDDNYMAKLDCDVPYSNTLEHESSIRSLGYTDPEYFRLGKITDKSDVYSFGVVLKELLTGKKKSFPLNVPNDESHLVDFCSILYDDDEYQLDQVLHDSIGKEENIEALKEVVYLAKVCLSKEGNERPTMTEVAMKLEALRN